MCVQQVGRPVQPDGRLPGARAALHADRLRERGPDDLVLVRLDGGHDVAHGAGAGPFDLRLHQARQPLDALPPAEQLVLDRRDLSAVETESSAPAQSKRIAPRGQVEAPGRVGPPVHDHRVGDPDAERAFPVLQQRGVLEPGVVAVAIDLGCFGRLGGDLVEDGQVISLIAELVVIALVDMDELARVQHPVLALVDAVNVQLTLEHHEHVL